MVLLIAVMYFFMIPRVELTETFPGGEIEIVKKSFSEKPLSAMGVDLEFGEINYRCEYEYDKAGNEIKKTYFHRGTIWRDEYEYDRMGNMVKETTYNTEGMIQGWHEYEYDQTGNILTSTDYTSDGSISCWYEYAYNSDGNKIGEKQHYKSGEVEWIKYEYDHNDKMIKELICNSDGSIYCWYEYEYDLLGNCIRKTGYDSDSLIIGRYEWKFDISGKLRKMVRSSCFDMETAGTTIEIKYNRAEKITESRCYYSDGDYLWWYECEYNRAGEEIKETEYNSDGSIKRWYAYKYDQAGNLVKETEYDSDGNIVA